MKKISAIALTALVTITGFATVNATINTTDSTKAIIVSDSPSDSAKGHIYLYDDPIIINDLPHANRDGVILLTLGDDNNYNKIEKDEVEDEAIKKQEKYIGAKEEYKAAKEEYKTLSQELKNEYKTTIKELRDELKEERKVLKEERNDLKKEKKILQAERKSLKKEQKNNQSTNHNAAKKAQKNR